MIIESMKRVAIQCQEQERESILHYFSQKEYPIDHAIQVF